MNANLVQYGSLGLAIVFEIMDAPGILGLAMIVGGVVVLNVFSKAGVH